VPSAEKCLRVHVAARLGQPDGGLEELARYEAGNLLIRQVEIARMHPARSSAADGNGSQRLVTSDQLGLYVAPYGPVVVGAKAGVSLACSLTTCMMHT
jgi:hypothetical protein